MDAVEALEQRIAELRSEIEEPEELVAADQAWRSAQAEARAAVGTPGVAAVYQRFRDQLDLRNRIALPRILEQGMRLMVATEELRHAEVQLAELRGDPYFRRVLVNRADLAEGAPSEDVLLQPASSGSDELFLQSAFGKPALALFAEISQVNRQEIVDIDGAILISFELASPMPLWGVSLAKFGYPNEEAFEGYPSMGAGFDGIGFYELLNSPWEEEIVAFNRLRFPDTPDDLGLNHFVVACKENTLHCLAARFSIQRINGGAYPKQSPSTWLARACNSSPWHCLSCLCPGVR